MTATHRQQTNAADAKEGMVFTARLEAGDSDREQDRPPPDSLKVGGGKARTHIRLGVKNSSGTRSRLSKI